MENEESIPPRKVNPFDLGDAFSDTRRVIKVFGSISFALAVTSLIAFAFFAPYYPEIYVSRFNVSSDNVFTVNLTFLNPNRDKVIIYYNLHAALFYDDRLIAETSLFSFDQKTGGEVTALKAKLPAAAAREYYIDDDDEGYRSMRFGARVFLSTKYTGLFNNDRHYLRAYCGDVGISLNYTMPCTVGTAY